MKNNAHLLKLLDGRKITEKSTRSNAFERLLLIKKRRNRRTHAKILLFLFLTISE